MEPQARGQAHWVADETRGLAVLPVGGKQTGIEAELVHLTAGAQVLVSTPQAPGRGATRRGI